MNPGRLKMKDGGWQTRSVLECGDSSALFPSATQSSDQSEHSKTCRSPRLLLFCFVLLHSAFCLCASAQSYTINWSTIDGGGGRSTGGVYSVSGTIGQPDANTTAMTGGNYALTGGFWAFYAVQTPGAPTLTIAPAGAGQAQISWSPATGTNWVLQQTVVLSPADWTNSPSGSTNPIVVPATLPQKFYRLFKP